MAATAVAPGEDIAAIPVQAVVETLPAPKIALETEADLPFVHNERIQAGDTLQALFRRLNVNDAEALSFISASDEGKQALRQLRAGRSVMALIQQDGRLQSFSLPLGNGERRVIVERDDSGTLKLRESESVAQSTLVEMRSGDPQFIVRRNRCGGRTRQRRDPDGRNLRHLD
ncbi:LysM-like peptidoglycan-binding domain-containing protein [Thauera humireducens]|uniref:LysM-like peptidoglycan-binding domain-containing protein n=1 Tax=Thauera humireducens TaxID=1134435 RepID=UPI003C78236C